MSHVIICSHHWCRVRPQRGAGKALADLDALDRVDAHHRAGQFRIQLAVDRRAQTRWNTIRHHFNHPARGVAIFAQAVQLARPSLRGFGIGAALTRKVVETYGEDALTVITRQPYRLAAEIRGIGFKTADLIATERGQPLEALPAPLVELDEAEMLKALQNDRDGAPDGRL